MLLWKQAEYFLAGALRSIFASLTSLVPDREPVTRATLLCPTPNGSLKKSPGSTLNQVDGWLTSEIGTRILAEPQTPAYEINKL